MPRWETKPLATVCQLVNRGISPVYIEKSGVAVLNQKCVRNHTLNLNLGRRHDAVAKKVPADRFLRVGDVLVNSTGTGTLGRVAQLRSEPTEPTTVDSHVTIVRPIKGKFYLEFFGYALVAIEDQIQQGGEGCGGQTELSRSKLANDYSVSYPKDLDEQRRIVAILDEAFEGIEAAVANAEKNLASARELFDSYLTSIFAHRDASWDEKTLQQVSITFGRGKSRHRPRNDPKLYGGRYPFIQTGEVRNCDHIILESTQTYNEAGLAQSKIWPKGTICITIAANIAETGILGFDACFPDSIIGVVVDPNETTNDFVRYLLEYVKAQLKAEGKGSAQDNINLATFESRKFPFPPLIKQKQFVEALSYLSEKVRQLQVNYEQKLIIFAELKRAILHKAFAGELTKPAVREAAE